MTKLTGNNYYHGYYYLPKKPEFDQNIFPGRDIAEMLDAGLTPDELAMNTALENSRTEDYINFEEVEELTHHWRLTDKQKALDGLVEKGHLIKCDNLDDSTRLYIEDITSRVAGCVELPQENLYERLKDNKTRLFLCTEKLLNCWDQPLNDVIDYMSQSAFGFYLACFDNQKDGLLDPECLNKYTDWDKNTINRGISILEKYGCLKRLYKIVPEYKHLVRKECQYYLIRINICNDFQEFVFD